MITTETFPLSLTRDSHYVPQATLRRWSEDGKNIWAYRLLVSHEKVPLWERRSIKGLVCQDDLYTTFSGNQETDHFERFITSIEEPGQTAIETLLAHPKMKPADWQAIAKFVAAQSMRTPLPFVEIIQAAKDLLSKHESVARQGRPAGLNLRHVVFPRLPAGPRPAARSHARTVVADTVTPRPFSSPTIRG